MRAYFDELTPVMLIKDTRVTNYGYRDGKPTPRQSVLQKGQLVLVDLYGVPRVRCECGNPLTPPKPVQTKPRYTGPRWPDFDPTVIIVIQPTTVVIPGFILVDILTGDPFERPPGTDGVADTVRQATDWVVQIDLTLFGHPLSWTAELVLNPDGTVSGTGQGSYQLPNGVTSQGSGADKVNTGTFSADASFTLGLSGILATTPAGKVLRVEPTFGQITLSNVVYDTTGDEQELRARLPGDMQAWTAQTLTTLELPAVDYGTGYATLMAGGDPQEDGAAGSATVTAVR